MTCFDVLILGSGPGGDTAAIYTARAGLKTCLITGHTLGGQLTITSEVENFPGFSEPIMGFDLMDRMLKQAINCGVEVIYDTVASVDLNQRPFKCVTENQVEFLANNIVIATGASTKWLGLKSEQEFIGHGVSGCAICDGNFFRNKIVAVIGAGESAGIEALHMSKLASKVYLICRKSKITRMTKTIQDRVFNNNKIDLIFNSEVLEIYGDDNPKRVSALKIMNNQSQEIRVIDLSAVFVAIGRSPQSEIFTQSDLKIDEFGYIKTKPDSTRTNIPNVYAIGDVANKRYKQAVLAAAQGCVAAFEIQEDN